MSQTAVNAPTVIPATTSAEMNDDVVDELLSLPVADIMNEEQNCQKRSRWMNGVIYGSRDAN